MNFLESWEPDQIMTCLIFYIVAMETKQHNTHFSRASYIGRKEICTLTLEVMEKECSVQ